MYAATVTLLADTRAANAGDSPVRTPAAVLFQNRSIAQEVIRRLDLQQPPYHLTPDQLVQNVVVDEASGGVVRLTARFTDAQLAAAIANQIAERGVQLDDDIVRTESDLTRKYLGRQVEEARRVLQDADDAILKYVDSNKSRVTSDSLVQAITGRPAAASDDSRDRTTPHRPLSDRQIATLLAMYPHESELRRLVLAREAAQRTYVDLAARYATARIQTASSRVAFQIVDRAIVPDWPVAPRTAWNLLIAAIAGVLTSVAAAFMVDFIQTILANTRQRTVAAPTRSERL